MLPARAACVALVAAWPALSACRPAAVAGTEVRIAVRADVTGFFPEMGNETYTSDINGSIFEGLTGFDGQLRLRPALAERWENPDERTTVFVLRPGLRFSDGRELTADDVVASLQAHLARHWVFADYLQAIDSVRALDARRVEVRTRTPYLLLLYRLPWGYVVPRGTLEAGASPRAVGTGPYQLESWTKGEEFVLVRNRFSRTPPSYDRVRFLIEPDPARRIALLSEGTVDVADGIPLEALAGLRQRPDLVVQAGAGNRVLFLGLRLSAPPFSDPRVREAIDLALDRAELIARALAGEGTPASQLVPPAVVGYDQTLALPRPDRGRARQLLAAAGFGRGLDLRLDGPNNRYANDAQILQEVARQLATVGIRVTVNAEEKNRFFARLEARDTNFYLLGWASQSGDAGDVLDTLVHSPGKTLGRENYSEVADRELDQLIDRASSTTNAEEHADQLRQAVARLATLRAVLPLVIQTEAVAHSRRVQWTPPLDHALRLSSLRPAAR